MAWRFGMIWDPEPHDHELLERGFIHEFEASRQLGVDLATVRSMIDVRGGRLQTRHFHGQRYISAESVNDELGSRYSEDADQRRLRELGHVSRMTQAQKWEAESILKRQAEKEAARNIAAGIPLPADYFGAPSRTIDDAPLTHVDSEAVANDFLKRFGGK
jgi:hypothetical protein